MVLSKATCPECCERIVVDIVNGYGYCMYCGAKVDTSDAVPLSSAYRNALRVELENTSDEGPWYGEVVSAFRSIRSGDAEDGLAELDRIISDNEVSNQVMDAIENQMIEWVVNSIDEGEPYRGGVLDVVNVMNAYEDFPPKVFLPVAMVQMGIKSRSIINRETAQMFIVSLFHFTRDYIPQYNNIFDFINICEHLSDLLDAVCDLATEGDDERALAKEANGYHSFLSHLCFMIFMSTENMSQKDMVKVNRKLGSMDADTLFRDLDIAFDNVMKGEDYMQPLMDFFRTVFDKMLSAPASKKKVGRKTRN